MNNYRPQTKFAKVMFLQLSVCPQKEGGVAGGRACMVDEGHAWWMRGMCGRGHAWQVGGVHGRGACVTGGCAWQGGMHGKHTPPDRYYDIWWYGQWAGGTHPTGMHSCFILLLYRLTREPIFWTNKRYSFSRNVHAFRQITEYLN